MTKWFILSLFPTLYFRLNFTSGVFVANWPAEVAMHKSIAQLRDQAHIGKYHLRLDNGGTSIDIVPDEITFGFSGLDTSMYFILLIILFLFFWNSFLLISYYFDFLHSDFIDS